MFSIFTKLSAFFKALSMEVAINGKSLVAFILNEIPGLSAYPGVVTALNEVATNPTKGNVMGLIVQLLWATGSAHKVLKIMIGVIDRLH